MSSQMLGSSKRGTARRASEGLGVMGDYRIYVLLWILWADLCAVDCLFFNAELKL